MAAERGGKAAMCGSGGGDGAVPDEGGGAGSGGEVLVVLQDVGIGVSGRERPLVQGVNLRVGRGERVLILGVSGSGKSSLLRTISGVVPHSVNADLHGRVEVAGVDTRDSSAVELSRLVGSLSQDPAASVCLASVAAEVALPLENRAVPRAEIGARIRAALRAVDAEHLIDRPTGALSGGEVQRVALAATIAGEPQVLLLDEPTSMLDGAGVDAVREATAAVIQRDAPAMLLVEHRLDAFAGTDGLAGLPGRTVVLSENGELIADGATHEVMLAHATALVSAGCWLPMEVELFAHTGARGGLNAAPNRALLETMALDAAPVRRDRGRVVLSARELAVAPGGQPIRRRRRRSEQRPATVPVLDGVDLDLHAGEIVSLLGANGVGKSSLLLTLASLVAPAGGTVQGDAAAMVFQNPEYQFLTHQVRSEVAWGAAEAAVVDRLLAEHRLEHLADDNPYRLSGGEKRRLSLAAMLAPPDRSVLLADEPTFGLDRRDTIATARALRAVASRGVAVCLSSHDLRLVAGLSDRVVVLAGGRVVADGPTADILARPDVMEAAGLRLPPLVEYLLSAAPLSALAPVLAALDDLVTPGPTGDTGINETLISSLAGPRP